MEVRSLYFSDNKLCLLDQRLLPHRIKYITCLTAIRTKSAIKEMAVRGAPAIGCAAAYGYYLDAYNFFKKNLRSSDGKSRDTLKNFQNSMKRTASILISARPTAVNLAWAVNRMEDVLIKNLRAAVSHPRRKKSDNQPIIRDIVKDLYREAQQIFNEDIALNKKIGSYGAELLSRNSSVLTHCNAGALATAGYGTALGIIRSAAACGKIKLVFVDETRPYLQGARLTAWELNREKIPYRIITDNMAGHFMSLKKIDAVIVGADRIASNGDTANKIGTYSLAVLAAHHKIPFYVAASSSTIDISIKSGADIVIEERPSEEVLCFNGKSIAPRGSTAFHPAFDITPAQLITAIITEKGIYNPRRKGFNFTDKDLTYKKI